MITRADTARLQSALPAWARATLDAHAADRRAYTYTREEWEAGATHDPLWNAAQRELQETGAIHNVVRMIWGKSVILCTHHLDEAERLCLRTAAEFPRVTFFAGKLIFQRESWWQRLLHNETAHQVQRRLQWKGLAMTVIPLRVRD